MIKIQSSTLYKNKKMANICPYTKVRILKYSLAKKSENLRPKKLVFDRTFL